MQFKVINLNVWLGGKLMPDILDFLYSENADILNIQEARKGNDLQSFNQTELIIKKKIGYKYSYFSPAFFDTEENGDSGNLIISKYPIVKTNTTFFYGDYHRYTYGQNPKYFPTLPRNIQHAEIKIGDQTINDYNLQGVWGYRNGSDNPERLKMSTTIVKQIKGLKNVVLTGDFNCQEGTKTINNIEKHVINIFKGERNSTFNMNQKTDVGYATSIVDFIFASKDLKLINKSMPQVNISDHYPLVAEFAL